ncbi:MetQ/NlpA family ABC transporter substrate-binding protein [Lactobacillus rossiae]|uniref:Lipoprotein n=1 Tax=Furfurilactobacillus rossiae TaxID=231049 RepID=A0A7C9IV65_9LACO|nr:MetQ/NlpA family ABC transporter substrate-binding protein [Furfurilactobacillus milii]MYV04602.1 MetQ/NlpA family ABC transporter substrate-binding protein [Furfurilactobacillus milii]
MNKRIRRILLGTASILALGLVLAGCGKSSSAKTTTVKVGIVGTDDEKIWKPIAQDVKKKGINLKIVTFTDYTQPNQALNDKQIDLNAFQHYYFLDQWNKAHKADLTPIGKTAVAPLGLFSKKLKKVSEFKKGDQIVIPNDATNEGRALNLLKNAGLIKLDNAKLPTPKDVTSNPKHLKITAVAADQTPRSLDSATAAVVNNTYAVDAKLNIKHAVYAEKIDKNVKPYINIIVSRKADKNKKAVKEIVKAYQTKKIADIINKDFKGTEKPAWNLDIK